MKTLRLVIALLVLAAAFSAARAPAHSTKVAFSDGGAPMPLCAPGDSCSPNPIPVVNN